MFDCCEIYILIYGIPGVDDLFNRFGTFRQMLKLFLQFDQCDFVLKLGGGGGGGWGVGGGGSYLRMEKKCHGCSQEPSPWRRFFWAPKTNVKMDGCESFV